jgi:chromosome segregation ATPase
MPSVETLPDDTMDLNPNKHKEELEHLRHERNVYEESYIRIQRELDQIQKENESLVEELKSKQDLVDGFDSQLEQERDIVKSEMKVQLQKVKSNSDEREKELVENHLQEKSDMESWIGEFQVSRVM